jgi:magnesium transporter
MAATGIYHHLLLPDLRLMLQENDQHGLREFCEALNPVVTAEVLQGLDSEEARQVLSYGSIEKQAEIFSFIEPAKQIELVEAMQREHLSKLIEAMAPDDRVDLLEHLDEDHVEAILPLIAQAEREEIRRLLSYPENSAGSIMTTEYASLPENITARDALERLRQQAPDRETIYYIFVVDENRHLHGVITLRELILARPYALLSSFMRRDVIAVHVNDDQQEAARQIARFDLLALPVLDDEQRLVGIITHDDVLDIVQEEAEEDAYRQSAMQPLEHSYFSTPLVTIAWKRGVWLLILAAVALVTAAILDAYAGITHRHGWLVWFLPMVLGSGGNTGSQSATLVIRAMATVPMNWTYKWRMIRRELLTGLLLGFCLGLFALLASHLLFHKDWVQAAVVAGTLFFVVTFGSLLGSSLPVLFEASGLDPALMSNPMIAAVSDTIGATTYYAMAWCLLELFATS